MNITKSLDILILVWVVLILLYNILYTNLPHMPGDIYLDKTGYKIYIPITSAIIISIALTLLLNHTFG